MCFIVRYVRLGGGMYVCENHWFLIKYGLGKKGYSPAVDNWSGGGEMWLSFMKMKLKSARVELMSFPQGKSSMMG